MQSEARNAKNAPESAICGVLPSRPTPTCSVPWLVPVSNPRSTPRRVGWTNLRSDAFLSTASSSALAHDFTARHARQWFLAPDRLQFRERFTPLHGVGRRRYEASDKPPIFNDPNLLPRRDQAQQGLELCLGLTQSNRLHAPNMAWVRGLRQGPFHATHSGWMRARLSGASSFSLRTNRVPCGESLF